MGGTLFQLWMATVDSRPSALALTECEPKASWTRARLQASVAEHMSSFPRSRGRPLASGCRVAMCLPNGAEWLAVYLALLGSHSIPVPIDSSEPEKAQMAAAKVAGASFFWRGGLLQRLGPARRVRGRTQCMVKLTSGSSGLPKALAVSHGQLAADTENICTSMGITRDDTNLAVIPFGYSYGLGNLVGPLILQGTRIVCASSALPHVLASQASRHRATVLPAVPPILRALAESDVSPVTLSSVRLVISAGSPLPLETSQAFTAKFGTRIHGFYGTSETGGIAYDRTGEATLLGRSVGSPLAGVSLRVLPAGRIRVASAAVLGKGTFSPADRATVDSRGELVLLGRTDRVFKIAGRRVDLSEIEAVLKGVPGVRDAFAHMGAGSQAALGAAVESHLTVAEIRKALRERLASWKIPGRMIVLGRFPRSSRGKTDSGLLRQALAAPRTATSISTLSSRLQISASR